MYKNTPGNCLYLKTEMTSRVIIGKTSNVIQYVNG